MGDHFQTVVDRDVSLEEAQPLADRIRDWLVAQEIIMGTMTDCVLSADLGYPPAKRFVEVVDTGWRDIGSLRTNGLAIIVGRTVFDSGQAPVQLVCRRCGLHIRAGDEWSNAVSEWYEGRGTGILNCPHCADAEPVTEWEYDPAFGFGNLGFEFWNWPPLKKSFIQELSRQLGHRSVFVFGKL